MTDRYAVKFLTHPNESLSPCLDGRLSMGVGAQRCSNFAAGEFAQAAVAAEVRLPDGGSARHPGLGVIEAWYAQPTTRYQHGVLGDAVEGGSLVAIDDPGQQFEHVLPTSQVFEDITPRVVDLDGDGRNEVVTIRSGVSDGASVVVYAIEDGALAERVATAPIGQPYRWLSIAGIAVFRPFNCG